MTTTYSTTTPDNRIATRTSKTKVYTHAVACLEVQSVATLRKQAEWTEGLAAQTPNGEREARIYAEYAAEAAAKRELIAGKADDELVEVGDWYVAGWTSREDLAVKLAAREGRTGFRTAILPVS